MSYVIIAIVILILLAIAIGGWYMSKKAVVYMQYNLPQIYTPVNTCSGMPASSYYHPVTVDEPSIIETQDKLLAMAKAPVPHPEMVFDSRLRREGNPWVGDLKIKPRTTGVYLPLNAEPADLQQGYFSQNY